MSNSLDVEKSPSRTRVVVAMSGGVDSSVVAALLKADGYDVVGVTLQLYDGANAGRKGTCCAGRDIEDARAVAARLGLPHYVLDYTARFRTSVIEPFARSYAAGETPVPCAACNNEVKFKDLLETARDLGADVLATGHYCATRRLPDGRRGLYTAADATRDQSYFLAGMTQDQLDFVRFPLGTLTKTQVREIAREYGLRTAEKSDSQDICFVQGGGYASLVTRLLPEASKPGEIVDEYGMVLGRHDGIINFTVGQRKGIGLGGHQTPLFVLRVDSASARVVVGPREALGTRSLKLRDISWLDGTLPDTPLEVFVRTRSTRPPVAARLDVARGCVEFAVADTAVAPGQTCVFYDGDTAPARVLGAGTVDTGAGRKRDPRFGLAA